MTVFQFLAAPRPLALILVLLAVPGATGALQPPHLNFFGNATVLDHILCTAASVALAVGIVITGAGLARGILGYKWALALAPVLAASAWGLICWWSSLLESPQMPFGVIF